MLDIHVSDPETHTVSKVSAYVDVRSTALAPSPPISQAHTCCVPPQFKIHTVTDDPRFAVRDFFVRRRYRDFVWLRSQLACAFPGAIIPPLPPADKPYKDDRFSTQFIQRRQAGLELFLRRVAAHTTLATSADLLTFLEAKVWELQTAKNATTTSWASSLLDSTDASMKRVAAALQKKTPDDQEVERLRAFSAEYALSSKHRMR